MLVRVRGRGESDVMWREMLMEDDRSANEQDARRGALNKRLESVGWALFLIMIGGMWMFPEERVPEGAWMMGAGVALLALNGARSLVGIRMSRTTIILGVVALALGICDVAVKKVPYLPIVLIVIGLLIILKPLIYTPSGRAKG